MQLMSNVRPLVNATNRFGIISVAFGLIALLASLAAVEANRLRKPGVGYLLNWIEYFGLVNTPSPKQVPEWRALGPFDLTDDLALKLVLVYAICFALFAMLLALLAQHKQENTLGLSIGFILGALALHIHGFHYSVSALLLGALLHAAIRARGERPNPSIERTSPGKPGLASHVKR
jgi:hypothetical protein